MNVISRAILLVVGCICCISAYGQSRVPEVVELYRKYVREGEANLGEDIVSGKMMGNAKVTASAQRVSDNDSLDEGEVALAVHPLDSNRLVLSFMERHGTLFECPVYYSSDGGQTWTLSSINAIDIGLLDFPGSTPKFVCDPVFAWDKNGRVYFSWIFLTEKVDSVLCSLNYAYSDNNGETWTVPSGASHFIGLGAFDPATDSVYNLMDGLCDRQWLAVDNSGGPNQGQLYCSYIVKPPSSQMNMSGLCVKAKAFSSANFGPALNVTNADARFGNIEVDSHGTIHLSFAQFDWNLQSIMYTSSTNGGTTFSTPVIVGTGSNLGGDQVIHQTENSAPNLAVDSADNPHIVYSSFPADSVASFYARSNDNGNTWFAPVQLNVLFGNHKVLMPVVSAWGNNVSVSATVIDNSDSAMYYEITSTDNGQTWSSPLLLSLLPTYYPGYYTAGPFFGHYNRSVRDRCRVYTGWSDGRDDLGPKVYFSRISYCTTGINELTVVTDSIQLEGIYPVPVNENIYLAINNKGTTAAVHITICDLSGKVMFGKDVKIANGRNQVALFLEALATGNYILSLEGNKGFIANRLISVQ